MYQLRMGVHINVTFSSVQAAAHPLAAAAARPLAAAVVGMYKIY